ncbi:MAG: magnesium chelatase, partial [Thermomicrobiales bacterium]
MASVPDPVVTSSDRPATLGQLRASGYVPKTVRQEMRANLIEKIRRGVTLFPGIVGYDRTVVPQIENAILSGQDIILLGERGQAKTRIARSLTNLLDEVIPIVAGSEINDDPFEPVSRMARDLVAARGEDTPIEWVGRDRRYGEKLATPDTTIADLIGEVDPIKV